MVATVASESEAWRALGLGAEVVEVRIDLMARPATAPRLIERLRETGVPRIATNRSRTEGGSWRGSEAERLDLLARCAGAADAVDLETSSLRAAGGRRAREAVRESGSALILSRHDLRSTPPEARLRAWLRAMFLQGAGIAKVAVTARRTEDLHALLSVLHGIRRPAVGIAMGAVGAPSRVMAGLFGSVLTYGCVDEPRAPGQLRVDKLRRMAETLRTTRLP